MKPNDCILIGRHWWRNCPRITNTLKKRPSNFNFSAFRAVIYQNLLCRHLCIVVRSWKLLSVNIVKYRCISPLNEKLVSVVTRQSSVITAACLSMLTDYKWRTASLLPTFWTRRRTLRNMQKPAAENYIFLSRKTVSLTDISISGQY